MQHTPLTIGLNQCEIVLALSKKVLSVLIVKVKKFIMIPGYLGDPSSPILRAYVGDPLKIRVIHGGIKETHVFHYHVHQWLFERNNVNSLEVDSLSISPQNTITVSPLYGAGSSQGAFGDVIIHCHLYPHFGEGMWGMNRIFNTLQDGNQFYPNGVPIAALQPLPDRPIPPAPTREKPGFPNFIPGVFGCKAPRPPLGIVGGRKSTELEINQFDPNARPGAVFVNPCPEGTKVERVLMSLVFKYLLYITKKAGMIQKVVYLY